MVSTFKRGLQLVTRKHATEGKPVESVPRPKQVAIAIMDKGYFAYFKQKGCHA